MRKALSSFVTTSLSFGLVLVFYFSLMMSGPSALHAQ
jgi:hypothetical protein